MRIKEEILKDMTPPPWKNTSKRHPKSTPLVRFRLDLPALSPTPSEPLAMRIYDARCEVVSKTLSSPATHMKFASELDQPISRWIPLPQAPSTMLCHAEPYDCLTIDLEQQGKVTSRYLGHGGKITGFSASESDPQAFLTTCHDGLARLYDLHTALPVLTFDLGQRGDTCKSALLIHPDSITSSRAEQIKMWDVRARTSVYELATGNNAVTSLAWDSSNNALYAATERNYYDYRHARKLREESEYSDSDENGSQTSLDDVEDDEDDGEDAEDEQVDVFEDRRD
ncbi:WD40 domain protein [Ceratobasidium sp. AG-Ba]|nr:WD40 domain protein [Ceratobasidium sp. AG-Ba]